MLRLVDVIVVILPSTGS